MCDISNFLGDRLRNLLRQNVLILVATGDADGVGLIVLEVWRGWWVLFAKRAARGAFWTIQGYVAEEDGRKLWLWLFRKLLLRGLVTQVVRCGDGMSPSPVWYQALLLLELCTNSLVLQVLGVVKKLHS